MYPIVDLRTPQSSQFYLAILVVLSDPGKSRAAFHVILCSLFSKVVTPLILRLSLKSIRRIRIMAFVYKGQENHVSNARKLRSGVVINQKNENGVGKRAVLGVLNADTCKGASKVKRVSITLFQNDVNVRLY